LIVSPSRTATVRAVSFSWPPVMIPSDQGRSRTVVEKYVDVVLGRQQSLADLTQRKLISIRPSD
jgi:hypothetical protein